MAQQPFILKINGPNRQQREIPRGALVDVKFGDEQNGGFGGCTIETSVDTDGLPTVQNGDSVTIFFIHEGNKELRYFGKIARRGVSQETGVSLTLTCEGESAEVGRVMLVQQFLEPGPPDISVLWTQIAGEVQKKRPDLFVQSSTVGLLSGGYEAFYKKFGDACDDIMKLAGGRVGWGVRRSPLPPYTPVLSLDRKARPGDAALGARTLSLPALAVSRAEGDWDSTDIRNILFLRGGVPANPNLVPNADFRLIEFTGDTFRNLLQNPSFDDGTNRVADHWDLQNGASKKGANLTEGPTHGGDYMVQLDNTNEKVQQIRQDVSQYIIPGHTYRIQAWSRRVQGAGTAILRIEIEWRDSGNNAIGTQTATSYTITDAVWNVYGFNIVCPAGATGFRYTLVAENPAILVDDTNLYDCSLILPRFHEFRLFGNSVGGTGGISGTVPGMATTQEFFNPTQKAVRRPGRFGNAPELALRTQDSDGNDAHFGMRRDSDGGENVTFPVSGNATYRIMVDLISPKTPNGGTYKNGKFYLVICFYKADGSKDGNEQNYVIPAGSGFAEWRQFSVLHSAGSAATQASVWLTFRGGPSYSSGEKTALGIPDSENGLSRIIVGGFCCRLAGSQPEEVPTRYVGQPALPGVQWEWIADGPYQTVISCTDVMPVGSAEYLSIQNYGEHPWYEEQDGVTTQAEATYFAQAIFYAYATERPNGSLPLEGDTRQFKACEGIRLRGPRGRALTSVLVPLTAVGYHYNGSFTTDLTRGVDRDDPYQLLTDFLAREQKAGGSGAGNGYYGSSGSGAGGFGGGSGGGSTSYYYWGTGARSASDPILHDDYTGPGTPHVSPTERTNWQNAYQQVADALHSAYLSQDFATLDARLENLEQNGGGGSGGLNWRGNWTNGTEYHALDAVFYNGSSWRATATSTGVAPSQTSPGSDSWQPIALKGTDATGTPGQGYNQRGAWDSATAYLPYDNVLYQGTQYVALANSTNVPPGSDPAKWAVFAAKGTDATGLPGQGYNQRGAWSNATNYVAYDNVLYQGAQWVALAASTNVAPGTNGAKWQLFADKGAAGQGYTFRSTWNSATNYVAYDNVTYNGSLWNAIAASTNVAPGSDAAKWVQVAAKGADYTRGDIQRVSGNYTVKVTDSWIIISAGGAQVIDPPSET